ncbi:E3 ubiquitin-protein ligase ATL4 [Cocos nucifera]|uniref:E3 ubiquitin-protein ligase ATL4 n=1 Tax=Cocos nucifera TaxID=13894 RepID=A0A8K0HTZ9_COCNU|nr:E3 ubiquitin-protein ligase ATL4 [Cocos nucifera]
MTNRLLVIATQIMLIAIIASITLLFIGIGVLVVLHVCIVGRAFKRWLITISRAERSGARNGLSADELEKLPCYDFDTAGEKGGGDCAVCLEIFQMGDRCRLLPLCKHSFHAQCVDSWLLATPRCPICRTPADHRFAGGVIMGLTASSDPSSF